MVFWYILSWSIDEDLEADISGDDEIYCIKAESFLIVPDCESLQYPTTLSESP